MTANDVSEWINKLGELESIKDELRSAGIVGIPGNIHGCLIARYLQAKTGDEITVDGCRAYVRTNPEGYDEEMFRLPDNVRELIHEFDCDELPEFVDRSIPQWALKISERDWYKLTDVEKEYWQQMLADTDG